MITSYGDFKHGSHNPEKPQESNQETGKPTFKQSSPAVCGLEKAAMGKAICYTGPFESALGFREAQLEKVAVLASKVRSLFSVRP